MCITVPPVHPAMSHLLSGLKSAGVMSSQTGAWGYVGWVAGNLCHLKTLQIEPKIISVKAAEAHILGVLTDGRIVFWYSLNPSENGVCITK